MVNPRNPFGAIRSILHRITKEPSSLTEV
jgi:hypothetical protein